MSLPVAHAPNTAADQVAEEQTGVADAEGLTAAGFDWPLLVVWLFMSGFGLLMILSASSAQADATYGNALHFVTRQAAALAVGALLGGLSFALPWSWLRRIGWPAYLVSCAGLLLVFTPLGHAANGAERWFSLGPINVQPSEFAKLALILVLGAYLSTNANRLKDILGVGIPAVCIPIPLLALVLAEPDFGTTVLMVAISFLMLFVAGLGWRWLCALGATAAAVLVSAVVVAPYRMRRIASFLDPFADPEGSGYQVLQGWIALASGGLTGQGLASGVAQRGFLPEAHTDFLAAVIGEELGAAGWSAVALAYCLIIWRGARIAARAPDLFGLLVASGLTLLLAMQAAINLSVIAGWLPPKGLVLPFLSYGASAAVVHTMCIGLLLRIGIQGKT